MKIFQVNFGLFIHYLFMGTSKIIFMVPDFPFLPISTVSYLGCYNSPNPRYYLPVVAAVNAADMTRWSCITMCLERGYDHAAIQQVGR